MSINQLFELSRRSFRTYDAAMQTTSDNIANAGVEGYHRRRITRAADATSSPGVVIKPPYKDVIGSGVNVQSYERMRDTLLERSGWQAQGGLGSAEEEARLLSAIEGVVGTGAEGNLTDVLGQFFDAWSDVADNPTDIGVRTSLLSQAETLTHSFKSLSSNLDQFETDTEAALDANREQVNSLLQGIADANVTIREARFDGSPDLAAEDQRDKQVKELAKLLPVRVQESEQGYTVTTSGLTLVQGEQAQQLELASEDDAPPRLRFAGSRQTLPIPDEGGGEIGAQLRTLHEALPDLRGELDGLAKTLVTEVNTLHKGGIGLDGSYDLAFFKPDPGVDPEDVTASNITLNVTDPRQVAASASDGNTPPASVGAGDNTQARALAALQEDLTNGSIDLMAGVGSRASAASSQATSQQAVVDHLEGMATGVSGVSIDEEMTNLIEHQQAFQASARVLSTAQTMMDTLLSL